MEYTIYCLACQSQSSVGGLKKAPKFSDEEVLKQAVHNPGCIIVAGRESTISSHPGSEPGVTIYEIVVKESPA